jgi:hypothetical protein
MFLKIMPGPGRTFLLTNVQTISFTSHLSSNVIYNRETSQFYTEYDDGAITEFPYENFVDNEELGAMSPYGNSKDMFYVHTATVKYVDGKTSDMRNFAFTGAAYFCDDTGKTLDVLR